MCLSVCLIILIPILILIYYLYNYYEKNILFMNTNQNKVNEIYQLLKFITCIFNKTDTQYTVVGGTLLGCIRHKGLIPWDTDGDIAVLNKSFDEILNILKPLENDNIQSYLNYRKGIVKVKFNNSKTVVDIFILHKDKYNIYKFTPPYDTKYPNEYFREFELYPLKIYKFGPIELYGPNLPINYLDRVYPNWNNLAEAWINDNLRTSHSKTITNIDLTIAANPNIYISKDCN